MHLKNIFRVRNCFDLFCALKDDWYIVKALFVFYSLSTLLDVKTISCILMDLIATFLCYNLYVCVVLLFMKEIRMLLDVF